METIIPNTLQLSDGRLLEYASYGTADGLPLVFFHGFIGSHHQAEFAHAAAVRQGFRMIAPNRPGVGRSTMTVRRQLDECVPDVRQLADALGLTRFAVIGVSGGAPYALACLKGLPQRVCGAALVSGLGPVGEPEVMAKMGLLARHTLRMSWWAPAVMRSFFRLRLRGFRNDPEGFLTCLIRRWSRSDQQLFARPEVRRFFIDDLREVLSNGSGAVGMVQEMQLYERWGFRLQDVDPRAKVVLWHGRDDGLVPAVLSESTARHFQNAEVTLQPGGHFMILDHAEEVLRQMRSVLFS